MKSMKNSGLTLIELVVIIAVVAILVLVLRPLFGRARESARRQTCSQQMSALQGAITMYEVDYQMYPTIAKGSLGYTERPQDALNLLYRQYVDDVRVFNCPSTGLIMISNVRPSSDPGFPGYLVSSYGYSPGHTSLNPSVIILADKKGAGFNSDNHGRNAGQNELTAGGSVSFVAAPGNRQPPGNIVGKDKSGNPIFDPDIFTYGDLKDYPDWDSGCQ